MLRSHPSDLRDYVAQALTKDIKVRDYSEVPTLEEFTDTFQADVDRQYHNLLESDNFNAFFDLARGGPLPAVSEARDNAHAAFHDLVKASRDPLIFATGDIQKICSNLAPPAEKHVNALADYCVTSLQANQASQRLGKRKVIGKCAEISWYTHRDECIDTTIAPRLMLFASERLAAGQDSDQDVREHVIAYIPKGFTVPPDLGRAAPFGNDISRCIERYPRYLQPLFRLEHGHKLEGQGASLSVLLLGHFVTGVFPPVGRAPATNGTPQQRGRQKPAAKPVKRRSIWAALHGVAATSILLLATLISSAALVTSVYYFHVPNTEARLQKIERLATTAADLESRLQSLPSQAVVRSIAQDELRTARSRAATQAESIRQLDTQQAALKTTIDRLAGQLADLPKIEAQLATIERLDTTVADLQSRLQSLPSQAVVRSIAQEELRSVRSSAADDSESISRLTIEQSALRTKLANLSADVTGLTILDAAYWTDTGTPRKDVSKFLAETAKHLRNESVRSSPARLSAADEQRLLRAERSISDLRSGVSRLAACVRTPEGKPLAEVVIPELRKLQSTVLQVEKEHATNAALISKALKESYEREKFWHDWLQQTRQLRTPASQTTSRNPYRAYWRQYDDNR